MAILNKGSGERSLKKCVALVTTRKNKKRRRRMTYIRGELILNPLWKTEVWKMDSARTGYCGNW
jgi:hypothetical protein